MNSDCFFFKLISSVLIVLVIIVCWFAPLNYCSLIKPDEGRYAIIAREMVQSGDWIVPRMNSLQYIEKPPMHYWMTAISFSLFGEHEWSARLWSAIAGMLGILMMMWTARRIYGREVALYSGLLLSSSIFYVGLSRINTVDMGLTLFMGVSLMAMLLAQRDSASVKENRYWMYIVWIGLALAVLTKGPMGVILPAGVLFIYLLLTRSFYILKKLHLGVGLFIFSAIILPWFILVSQRNSHFLKFFFIREHVERFLTNTHNRDEVWWYLFPFVFLGILPWMFFLLVALISSTSSFFKNILSNIKNSKNTKNSKKDFKVNLLLTIWCFFIFIFFSLSSSKLPTYVLPIFPALALLLGQTIKRLSHRHFLYQVLTISVIALVALLFAPQIANYPAKYTTPQILYYNWSKWVIAAGLFWFLGSIISLVFAFYKKRLSSVTALSLSFLLATQIAMSGYEELAPSFSSSYAAKEIIPYVREDRHFYSIKMYDHTLPFYIKHPLTLVEYKDEMAFGIDEEPNKWVATVDEFKKRWRSEPGAMALLSKDMYQQFKNESLPMKFIFQDSRRTIILSP
ncbi:MAG: glycosyltransferase family 39 protein [Oligoflexia bacterium]|nr:glycosyltransferase family 39 protein [Oligoflexia bacterium]